MNALKSEIENIDKAIKEIIEIDKKENYIENNEQIIQGDTIHEDAVLEEQENNGLSVKNIAYCYLLNYLKQIYFAFLSYSC